MAQPAWDDAKQKGSLAVALQGNMSVSLVCALSLQSGTSQSLLAQGAHPTLVLLCSPHACATIVLFLALTLTQSLTDTSLITPTALTNLCCFLPSPSYILLPALSCAFFVPCPTGMDAASQYRVAFARSSPANRVVAAIFNPHTLTHKLIAPYGISAPLLVLWVPESDSSST